MKHSNTVLKESTMRTKVIVQLFSRGWKAWNSTHMFTCNFLFVPDFNEKPWCPIALFRFEDSVLACNCSRAIHPDSPFLFVFIFFFSLFATDNCTKINSFPMVLKSIQMCQGKDPFSRKWNKTYGRELRTLVKIIPLWN